MKEEVLVLGVSSYSFQDEQTGRLREGAHVHYVVDWSFNESEKKGMFPVKIAVPMESFIGVESKKFPAICNLNIITLPDGKGKPKPTVVGVEYVKDQTIFPSNPVAK